MARTDTLLKITKTLLARRNELRKRLGMQLDDMGGARTSGDVADVSFGASGEEMASQLAQLESQELAQTELALVRLKQGRYGVCDVCGSTDFVRRPDDNEATVRARMAEYRAKTAPIADHYSAKGLLHRLDGMASMDALDYADMVEQTPVDTAVVEYRDGGPDGALIAACLIDRNTDGLSMIYSFYDPDLKGRGGLGTWIILEHIERARAAGLGYVYLGYWIEGARKMDYKIAFKPVERLSRAGWVREAE